MISQPTWVDHHLAIAAVPTSSWPARCRSMQESTNVRVTVALVASSARVNRVFWKVITGLPNAVRSLTYCRVSSIARSAPATAVTAMISRSCGSCRMSWTKPCPSASPSRLPAGTRTSSKNSSAVSWPLSPILSSTRPRRNPGRSRVSTTTSDTPCAPRLGSVLAATMTRSAWAPLVMNVFDPVTTYSPSCRIARVVIACRSEPVPGSVTTMPLCTALPQELSTARACSSSSTASWAKVPPPPPYSSGIDTQSRPRSPALFQKSRSTCCCLAQRSMCGTASFAKKVRASSRSWSSSPFSQPERYVDVVSIGEPLTAASEETGSPDCIREIPRGALRCLTNRPPGTRTPPWQRAGSSPGLRGRGSAEVAGGVPGVHRQRDDAVRDDVDHAVVVLAAAAHQQRTGLAGHPAEALPHPARADHVREAGLVLEVDERGAARGGRPLPVGDHAGDQYPGVRRLVAQPAGGHHAEPVQPVPDELGGVPARGDPGGPQVGHRLLHVAHPGQHRGGGRLGAGQLSAAQPADRAGRPQRLPAAHPEAVQRASGGQRLDHRGGQHVPGGQVGQVGVRATGGDPLRQVVADVPDRGQPEPDHRLRPALRLRLPPARQFGRLQGGLVGGGVHVRAAHHHPVPAGVRDQRLR